MKKYVFKCKPFEPLKGQAINNENFSWTEEQFLGEFYESI